MESDRTIYASRLELLDICAEQEATIATLRAALGKARLELMQDVDPDAIIAGIAAAIAAAKGNAMTTPERDPGYPYGEFDAHEWAIEFDRNYPDHRPDIDTMLVWFANAIMTGYDRGKNESAAADQAALTALRGAYREAADWITAVQSHYVLGPEASPEDIFMVAGERQEAELATLRAALADEKERNGLYLATLDNMNATIAHLRAALGKARLELMQDVDPDAIIDVIDCALTP